MDIKNKFRKTKYGLPLVMLPFILLGAYVLSGIFPPKNQQSAAETQIIEGLNSMLPDPALSEQKDKFELLLDLLKRRKDESGLQNLDEMLKELESELDAYDSIEIEQFLDPITDTSTLDMQAINIDTESALRELQKKYFPDFPDLLSSVQEEERKPQNAQSEELKSMREQIARMDSLLQTQSTQHAQSNEDESVDDILKASKADDTQSSAFNTISANKRQMFITAILDEAQTVADGSRIRIRLLDDIFIGDHLFKKGSYLYGLVSGFSAQRVNVTITTVLYGDRILKTKLTIYDNDGIKGLYVPNSDFRDMMRVAASRMAQSSNVNINQPQASYQQLMNQMGQDFYRSVTQAVSTKIKQNKAKLKYASIIYLMNEDNNSAEQQYNFFSTGY